MSINPLSNLANLNSALFFSKEEILNKINDLVKLPENERPAFLDQLFFQGHKFAIVVPIQEGIIQKVVSCSQGIQPHGEESILTKLADHVDLLANHPKTNNAEFMLAALRTNKEAFKYLSADLQKNKELFLKAIEIEPRSLTFAAESLREEIPFLTEILIKDPKTMTIICQLLEGSENLAATLYSSVFETLKKWCEEHQSFDDVQKNKASQLYQRSFELKKVAQDVPYHEHKIEKLGREIIKRLDNSQDYVLRMISVDFTLGRYMSSDLTKKLNFFLKVIQMNPYMATYFDSAIENDHWLKAFDVVLNEFSKLIEDNLAEDQLAAYCLKINRFIENANRHLDEDLDLEQFDSISRKALKKIADPKLLIKLFEARPNLIPYLPETLCGNTGLMAAIARIDFEELKKHPHYPVLANDVSFWNSALSSYKVNFDEAPDTLRSNPGVIKELIKGHPDVICNIPLELKTQEFALECFKVSENTLEYFDFQKVDDRFVEKACLIHPAAIRSLKQDENPELIKKLILANPDVIQYIAESLWRNVTFAYEAYLINPNCLKQLEQRMCQYDFKVLKSKIPA